VPKHQWHCATGIAPGDAGRAARRQDFKSVAVATVYRWRLAAGLCSPGGDGELLVLFCQQRLAVGV